MAQVRWTREAESWLREIFDYIARDNERAARDVVTGIHEKAQYLLAFPEMGYRYRTEPEGDLRILLWGHYRIAYLIRETGDIDVIGVFHGALDIDRYLP